MEIDVRFRELDASDALREYVARRLHFALSRFGSSVTSVSVRFGDINGPKGGLDKRCHLTVRGPSIGTVLVEEHSADAFTAADIAADRASRAVGRAVSRAREARAEARGLGRGL